MRAIVALTAWVLAFLPAALQAQDVPIIKDSEAAQYVRKTHLRQFEKLDRWR
jgi:hypothetical protein